MLTSIWRPQNAAPGGRCPPLPPFLVTPLVWGKTPGLASLPKTFQKWEKGNTIFRRGQYAAIIFFKFPFITVQSSNIWKFSMKTSFAQQQSFVATPSVNHMKQAQCRYIFFSKALEKLF